MTIYGHVDADCFYVSCERVRDRRLRDKPVAVLGNQGACVIAESYEMKQMGVDVAMPIWLAKNRCPEGIFVKRDFQWYGLLSREMQKVLQQFTDEVEYYSIDESFFQLGKPLQNLSKIAKKIQREMQNQTKLPVSVGLSTTRTLCKLASKMNKPYGTLVIHEENRESILKETPLQKVNGIGRRLIQRAHRYGFQTALEFAQAKRPEILSIFHRPGEALWYELNGIPVFKIHSEREARKIVSRGGSIWGHHKDKDYIWGFLIRNLERFLTALWIDDIEIRGFRLILSCSDGGHLEASQEFPDYTSAESQILEALTHCFKKAYLGGIFYDRVHLIGFPVRQGGAKQMSFFKEKKNPSEEKIKKIKLLLNERFGLFTLRKASTNYAAKVFKDKVSDFEITDVPGKHLF